MRIERIRTGIITITTALATTAWACEQRVEGEYTTKEVAAEKHAEMEQDVRQVDQDTAGVDEEAPEKVAELKTDEAQLNRDARADALEEKRAELIARFDALRDDWPEEHPVYTLNERIEADLDALDDRFGELNPKDHEAFDTATAAIGERLDELEAHVNEAKAEVSGAESAG